MNKIKKIALFIILFMGMALFPYIPLELFHVNLDNLSQNMKILYNFVCDVGFMIIILMVYDKRNITEFKDYLKNFKKYIKESLIYYIIGLILMYVSNIILATYASEAMANNDVAVKNLIDLYPLYMFFSTFIYAPVVEETIFRRSIKDIFLAFGDSKFIKYLYIIFSGLLFSSMHVLGMVNNSLDYLYIIPYLAVGISFAALYYKTDNLFTTITMHALHNALAIILYLLVGV